MTSSGNMTINLPMPIIFDNEIEMVVIYDEKVSKFENQVNNEKASEMRLQLLEKWLRLKKGRKRRSLKY